MSKIQYAANWLQTFVILLVLLITFVIYIVAITVHWILKELYEKTNQFVERFFE